jgi:SAM-dependent methyltransferase
MSSYGTADWFETAYRRSASDPWGLDWRPTQLFRYGRMLSELLHCALERQQPIDCVVDVGCATGDFTDLLSRALPPAAARQVIGVDMSPTAIERARHRHPHLDLHVAALAELPRHVERPVDLLCCLEVLYYLPREERLAALDVFSTVMRPRGMLLVSSMIGQAPYMCHEELCELIGTRFDIVAASCLTLWPLVSLEKMLLRLAGKGPRFRIGQFVPGSAGFNAVRRLSRACALMFGERARSHSYVIATRR